MKACISKLRSQKGASLILAAVYFLICAFVGGTVLAAATSGSAHLKDRKSDEQAFLVQRSAARVIEQELSVTDGYLQAVITPGETPALELTNASPSELQELVAQAALVRYKGEKATVDETTEGDLTLTMSADSVSDVVSVHYEVGDNYDLTVSLKGEDGTGILYVFMKASVSEITRDSVTITTVTWNDPVIRKGEGAA